MVQKMIRRLLSVLFVASCACSGQNLLFKSGFESSTALLAVPGGTTGPNAFIQTFSGTDTSTGFAWPISAFGPTGINGLHIEPFGSDLISNHFNNFIDTSQHHSGSKSLFTDVFGYANFSCCPQVPLQSSSFTTPVKQVYIRYWLMYPSSLATQMNGISTDYGREISAFKTSHDYRMHFDVDRPHATSGSTLHGTIQADALGMAQSIGNGCPYIDPIDGTTANDCNWHFAEVGNSAYTVPIGSWFQVEFWIRRVSGGPGGKLTAAVDGHVVGDFDFWTSNYGINNEQIQDFYWIDLYNSNFPFSQWLDDFEIWDAPPCAALPCATAQVGGIPPAIESYQGAVGTVGVPFSFQPIATNSPTSWHYNNYASSSIPPGLSFNTSTGLISGTPTTTGKYKIYVNATNASGNGAQTFEIQINGSLQAPVIKTFAPYPTTIASGGSSTLYTNVVGATVSMSVNQSVGALTGLSNTKVVNPTSTTTYTLTASNPAGTVTAATTVTVTGGTTPTPPTISSFMATPSTVSSGGSSTLAWSVSGTTPISLSINQGVGTVTGSSVNVSPSGTTTYTLTATNIAGTNSAQVAVTVSTPSRRVVGLEPSRQFSGTLPAGVSECAYGSYLRAMTSAFGGSCPNFIKEGDMWPHAYWPTSAQAAYMPASSMAYNVKVTSGGTSGLPGQIFFGGDQTENIMNAGDSTYLNWLHTVYLPLVMSSGQAGTTKTKFGWYLWTMDGFTPNLDQLGTTVGTSFTTNVTPDIGFPQTASAWNAGWAAYFTYAKTHNSPVRFSPHLGRMEDWGQFQTIFADCPALLREWFNMSDLTNYNIQFYNQTLSMYWFANVAPPVFPNDPPTRIIDYGVNVNNGDIHTGLAIYSMIRGPNTFFSCLNGTQTACDPALWLPTANKLGDGTSGPVSVIGTGLSSVLKRTFQGGIAYLDVKAGPQTVSLPPGSFDWNGNPITSLSLNTGKGDVVLNTNVIVGNGPVVSSFSASPSNISSGASSTLSWSVTNATSLSITPGIGTVTGTSVSVSPTVGTTYTLTASNANGSVSASTTVTVGGSGGGVGGSHAWWRVNTTLASNACCAGNAYGSAAAEIAFRTTVGGSNVATGGTPISGGNYPGQTPNLAFDSNPTTFWAGPGPIFGPPVLTWIGYHFASPQPIAEYAWTSRDGIADYQVPINMDFDYSDDGTTWITLCSPTSTDADWPVVSQTNSFSCPGLVLPTITSFTASPSTITSGSSTLAWSTSGAASLSINQGIGTVTGSTSISVSPALTTTYTLTATNSAGSVSQTVTVTVSSVTSLPVISSFTATPSTILPSGSSTLAWTTSGSTSLSIDHGVGTVTGLTSASVSPTVTTIYTLTATNLAGSVTQSVTVTLQAPPLPTIVNFIATPPVISLGGSSTLSWVTQNAVSLSIDQGIGLVTGTTSKVVSPTVTTTYTLTVSNSVGQVTGTATVTIGAAASVGFTINGATIRGATIPTH